jgi:hypothetical protein
MASVVLPVPGGYEAVTYDQHGHIDFWDYAGLWRLVAKQNYPRSLGVGDANICGKPGIVVTGALLHGARHATYIVCGQFSGDGSGWDVVFTRTADGWRYVMPRGRDLVPTGFSATYFNSLFLYAHFADGRLVTGIDTGVFGSAFASAFPLAEEWRYSGTGFERAHDSSFTARAASAPTISPSPLPTTPSRNGVYGVAIRRIGIKSTVGFTRDAQVTITVEPEVIHGPLPFDKALAPSGPNQVFDVAANTNVLFPVFRGSGISYITAPAWYIAGLALSNGKGINIESLPEESPATFSKPDQMPWYIPPSLHVSSFAAGTDSFTAVAKPASAELTFRNGVIDQIAIALY